MKRVTPFLIGFFLISVLVGCTMNSGNGDSRNENNNNSNSNNTGQNNSNSGNEKPDIPDLSIKDYFPMKENTRYIFEGVGNEFASYEIYNDYIQDGKIQQRINNGGTITSRVIALKDGKLIKVYSRGETYYRENLLKETDDEEEILLKDPLKKGTTWKLSNERVRTITNTSVDINTPTGNYKAIEVTTESANDKIIDYFAKNVGIVKTVFISGGNEVSSTLSKMEKDVPLIQSINFYYPNIDDGKIYYKSKEISFKTNDITRKKLAQAFKEDLNNQLKGVFSVNTEINSLYLNQDQHVDIDLNQNFIKEMTAGAAFEGMILQSVVNTIGQYYQSERVYLTIDNKPYESGHITKKKGEYFKVDLTDTVEMP
jgi:hypothetical protein